MTEPQVIREIAPDARVAPDAKIGPFCTVGPDVTIGPGTVLVRRVSIRRCTQIGSGNHFEEGCAIGEEPQDLKYAGQRTLLIIGHDNYFGRCATAHIGTEAGGYLTRIGDGNVIDDGAHIAHDCYLDDRIRIGRNVLLAGHIRVHTGAEIGDMAGVQHFVTIGCHARVGPRTPVRRDVPPYTDFRSLAYDWAAPPAVRGVHEEGIRAADLDSDAEKDLRRALSELFEDETALQTKIEYLNNIGVEGESARLCEFVRKSLEGPGGRSREKLRGQVPEEARLYLPPEYLAMVRRTLS